MPFRESNIGGPILMGLAGAIILILAPATYMGLRIDVLSWILIAWAVIWLVGETVANGTARAQMNGNLIFREANMGTPSMIGALGSVLIWAIPHGLIPAVPLGKVGAVLLGGALVWLVVETLANGVTRRRGRTNDPDRGDAPPVIIGS